MNIYTVKCNMAINGIVNKAIQSMKNAKVTTIFDTAQLNDQCDFIFYQWPDESKKGLEEMSEILGMSDGRDVGLVIVVNISQSDEMNNILKDPRVKIIVNPIDIEKIQKILITDEVDKLPGINTQALKADYINPFIESTINVISQVAGVTPKKRKIDLVSSRELVGDVSGVIGLAGAAEGFLIIILSMELSRKLVSGMLGTDVDKLTDDDLRDGVGELVNIVSGNAKAALVDTPYHFELSIPTVIIGSTHSVSHPPGIPCITVTFAALDEEFKVAVALIPKEAKN